VLHLGNTNCSAFQGAAAGVFSVSTPFSDLWSLMVSMLMMMVMFISFCSLKWQEPLQSFFSFWM
jgi:hypothetical protein